MRRVRQEQARPWTVGRRIGNYARAINLPLRPYLASDQYSFGLIVCRIGDVGAWSLDQARLFRVNHKDAQVGGDQYRLRRGDEVLWYFADFASGENTGAELELRTPAHVRPNQPFGVQAVAHDASGRTTPASGMQIWGGATAITVANGWASVEAPRAGTFAPAGRLWQRHPGRLDDEVRQPRALSSDAWRADSPARTRRRLDHRDRGRRRGQRARGTYRVVVDRGGRTPSRAGRAPTTCGQAVTTVLGATATGWRVSDRFQAGLSEAAALAAASGGR
jgi:hypothetical protein